MSTMQVTGWIPCTTPPVREGEYEMMAGYQRKPWRVVYRDGEWFNAVNGLIQHHTMLYPIVYQWRGVRRWVLTTPGFIIARSYVAHVSKRGVLYTTSKLHAGHGSRPYSEALSFETKDAAMAYAIKHARYLHNPKAVLA